MRNKKRILRTSGTARMPFAPRRAAVPAFASLGRMMDGRMRATGRPALPDTRQHHEEAASVLCGKHSSTLRQVLEYPAESTMQNSARPRAAFWRLPKGTAAPENPETGNARRRAMPHPAGTRHRRRRAGIRTKMLHVSHEMTAGQKIRRQTPPLPAHAPQPFCPHSSLTRWK